MDLLQEYAKFAGLTSPLALAIALWVLIRQVSELRRLQADTKKLEGESRRIPYEIDKLSEEKDKIHAERSKIPYDVEKITEELQKLRLEQRQLQASVTASEILNNRAKLNYKVIVECIDAIQEQAKNMHLRGTEAYSVFLREDATEKDIRAAVEGPISIYINESRYRGEFEHEIEKLKILLAPLQNTSADMLAPIVDEYRFIMSYSRQHDDDGNRSSFADMIRRTNYQPTSVELGIIRKWLMDVRHSYESLESLLGRLAAEIELRSVEA